MSIDTIIGLLIGLSAVCMGGLFGLLTMYWLSGPDQWPPGPGFGEPDPPPPVEPIVEIPDFVPQDWVDEAV